MFADRDSDDDDGYGEDDDNDDDEAHHPIKQALATAHFARRQVSKRSNLTFFKAFLLKNTGIWLIAICITFAIYHHHLINPLLPFSYNCQDGKNAKRKVMFFSKLMATTTLLYLLHAFIYQHVCLHVLHTSALACTYTQYIIKNIYITIQLDILSNPRQIIIILSSS